ncbi:MAG TPA: hypothetical protein IAC46_03680 [Candidatus Onthoplasma faecigallinarum]|nr:hypothetical protein [Candidatus Onthoplasma faecigallinarum]
MNRMKGAGDGLKILGSVLIIILCIILVISVIRIVFGGSNISFSAFLNYIQNVPQIEFIGDVNMFSINGDWGLFDFLKNFLNSIMSIFNFLVWLCFQLFNCLSYIFYFLKFVLII